MRSKLAAASLPLRDLAGAFEEHVIWRIGDLLRGAVEALRWPFEQLAWGVERRLVWPLRERLPAWDAPRRAAGAGALAAVAICAVAVGALALRGGDGEERLPSAEPVVAVAPTPPPEEEPTGPVLRGVAPEFGIGDGVGVAAKTGAADGAGVEAEADDATAPGKVAGETEETGATTSSQKPVPAGPAAMKVARRFSAAFVFYEIGERPARSLSVFEQTATPQLATALAERPPRQPQSTEVPKARILNLVPGPRSGRAYTVSASLLRVGTVSELRLKLAKQAGAWVVTDVRG